MHVYRVREWEQQTMQRPRVQLSNPSTQPSWVNAATCWPGQSVHPGGYGHRRGLQSKESRCAACSCQNLNRLEPWLVSKCHERQHPKGI